MKVQTKEVKRCRILYIVEDEHGNVATGATEEQAIQYIQQRREQVKKMK